MISFNNLGHMGRLGNQMFQYAALKGIANHKGYWYSIPEKIDLINCFKLPSTLKNYNYKTISTNKFEFDKHFFDTCPDDIDISGYFQTEKYFKHIEKQIRQDFVFNEVISKECFEYKYKIFSNTPLISVHIRRTDYLTDTKFECLDIDYYCSALKLLPKFPILIFSDDIKWCKENIKFENAVISPFKNQYMDLCMMTMCDYHIIANSSFSWWGSWLGKSRQTIAPKKWFCGEFSNFNTEDLYLPEWITL